MCPSRTTEREHYFVILRGLGHKASCGTWHRGTRSTWHRSTNERHHSADVWVGTEGMAFIYNLKNKAPTCTTKTYARKKNPLL